MTASGKRLNSLVRIADHQRAQAALLLSQARQDRDRMEATLGLLHMHFNEYRSFLARPQSCNNMQQLREFQHFVQQLQQAIEQQEWALQQAQERIEQLKLHFLQRHNRYRALDLAREQRLQQEMKQQEKQMQKLLDEMAARTVT